MAAQEYYQGSGSQVPPPPPPFQPPPMQQAPPQQHIPRPSSQGSGMPPYPLSDAPPPYQAFSEQQRPQSQPPMQRIPQHNGYQPYNPGQQQNTETHQYPAEKPAQRPSALHNMYRPSEFTSSHPPPPQVMPGPPPYPPQQQTNGHAPFNGYAQSAAGYAPSSSGYFAPAGPGLSQLSQQPRPARRSSTSGYPTAQSSHRDRSRSRDRDRKHKHNHDRPPTDRKKSSSVNTFLGAGGGAIIGDLIFPGLGTIGGALLGGVGGHEYSKKRPSSTPSRAQNRRSANSNSGEYYEDDGRRGRKY
ncbi:hypothetical protein LTR09_008891 [Extremus antarcticus]|uniref:Uncharacterized protein n=1 Tax=Extremus antarcticus TaxID=702011 RepID=A0AAJ0DA08_9PEZI|nr:hypothetical protein LTR09_008891 [Extremus antarcticus]